MKKCYRYNFWDRADELVEQESPILFLKYSRVNYINWTEIGYENIFSFENVDLFIYQTFSKGRSFNLLTLFQRIFAREYFVLIIERRSDNFQSTDISVAFLAFRMHWNRFRYLVNYILFRMNFCIGTKKLNAWWYQNPLNRRNWNGPIRDDSCLVEKIFEYSQLIYHT